ncbi:outer membrane beta-barrel family protein [Chryseobacterium formosus]|uniref:Outer membrane beta-barrel family protein n=1 Tax=Chryseobacterium formosus TaxID=1537363 RepID=A0ABT3XVC4_9FLAO|nr:outer membrane beta-barrel protein [Chryseobacterium formosus]MCX8525632.1 outer membrane beta-barrel family protein [Chryseobacterium formosus]
MKKILAPIALLIGTLAFAQQSKDTLNSKEEKIEAVTMTYRKPTVEAKVDRTVFNVANSSILAGNTTWDVLRMTPLVSIDNNDALKAEGESVTVYINDRKSVFTGKELKEYLQTIPADNLMKIEVITSPSSRYEASGSVINIVLKKRDDEGMKGSITLNNRQNTQNSQYTNLNLNYHKKKFTQTFVGSYSDNTWVQSNTFLYNIYKDNIVTEGSTNNIWKAKNPSISSTSEYELNDKNTIGVILELYRGTSNNTSDSESSQTKNNEFDFVRNQSQKSSAVNSTLGTNFFYKYYDKEKNRILDVNLGTNYNGESENSFFQRNTVTSTNTDIQELGVLSDTESRNYYVKLDYTQPFGKSGGNFEIGGKIDFNNNVIPNEIYGSLSDGLSRKDTFHYEDMIGSAYANYSKTFFEKLETRVGLRYEYIDYKIRQDITGNSRNESYGKLFPSILVKYSFSDKYDISLTYNKNFWRPWYAEFNPFLQPTSDGFYTRGNLDLLPNPSDRLYMKFGFMKKYFLSARYQYTNQDYWSTDVTEGDKIITESTNYIGKVHKYNLFANTNQSFLKNKLNVNLSFGWNYIDNSDFNERNDLEFAPNYISFWSGSTNLSYTNLFNKNINVSAWVEVSNQNNGNSVANRTNIFHNISATKIFPKTQMEFSLQLMNIFGRPNFDSTRFSETSSRRSSTRSDWHGFALTFVKRFGNQKVRENTKTDVEKNSGGGK